MNEVSKTSFMLFLKLVMILVDSVQMVPAVALKMVPAN